ncbi:hypothetical protein [Streptomyces pseudovenezuelae]|jgi:hypothetical protein|uniref:hypothetical protein n=1 Tax=Streptomyces pseudovenezuelae TaxID=67350 RepID=UPI0036E54D2F
MPDLVYAGQRVTADMLSYRPPYPVAHAALTANSASINSTTEVTILTTGSATFTAGRAYRLEYNGLVQFSGTSQTSGLYLRFRRTTGSALIRNVQLTLAYNGTTDSRNTAVTAATIVTPTATITDTLYLSAARDLGITTTWLLTGTAGTPGLLTAYDVGPASDYPGIATFS